VHTREIDATDLAELDLFMRLSLIGEQSQGRDKGLTARIASAYVLDGEDAARSLAGRGEHAEETAARVIAFMRAVRTERSRGWRVGFDLHGKAMESSHLDSPEITRAQFEWTGRVPGATAVRITEYTDTRTSAVADVDRLPHDDYHHAPEVPGAHEVHRFYRFDAEGPAVLPDAAAVARTREWMRIHRPRRYALPLLLLDTVRVVVAREVGPDQVTPL